MPCRKCELLAELYDQVSKTPRNYWVMTELVVLLHGSDVCNERTIMGVPVEFDTTIAGAEIRPTYIVKG